MTVSKTVALPLGESPRNFQIKMVGAAWLEHATPCSQSKYSTRLSYAPKRKKSYSLCLTTELTFDTLNYIMYNMFCKVKKIKPPNFLLEVYLSFLYLFNYTIRYNLQVLFLGDSIAGSKYVYCVMFIFIRTSLFY